MTKKSTRGSRIKTFKVITGKYPKHIRVGNNFITATSPNSLYVELDEHEYYIDNSTNEQIFEKRKMWHLR